MKRQSLSLVTHWLLILLIAIGVTTIGAAAQDRPQSLTTGPRMVVIPWRSAGEISGDIENAQATKKLAVDRRIQAEGRLREIETAIDKRKMSLKDVDRHSDDAKTGKRESEVTSLKLESKAGQNAIDLLNRLKNLRKAEIDEALTETKLADMEIATLQMENELLQKRTDYDSVATSGASDLTLTTAQQVLGELEVRLLKLQRDQAGETQELASRQKDIVNQRMKLHDAQLKMGIPRA